MRCLPFRKGSRQIADSTNPFPKPLEWALDVVKPHRHMLWFVLQKVRNIVIDCFPVMPPYLKLLVLGEALCILAVQRE